MYMPAHGRVSVIIVLGVVILSTLMDLGSRSGRQSGQGRSQL